jgi:hypothetical protein
MEAFDFNTAPEQRDVIPKGEIVVGQLRIRPGNAGKDGLLTRSQKGDCEGLNCEVTVVEGKYAKRKLFPWLLLDGTTSGQKDMAHSNLGTLKAIIESAHGISPKDVSETAKKTRASFSDLRNFDGIRFMLKVGVQAQDDYPAQNIIQLVITPDMKEWRAIQQVEQPLMHVAPTDPNKAIVKPVWAQPQQ